MSDAESHAIGRPGGEDDEPSFDFPPSATVYRIDAPQPSEESFRGRAGGDDDEPELSPGDSCKTITVSPVVNIPPPTQYDKADARKAQDDSGSSWISVAAGLVFWGIVAWLAVQVAGTIRLTLALPLIFRVPVLVAEIAALCIAALWLVRIAGLFIGFHKHSDADGPAYYRRIGESGTFLCEFKEAKRELAREAVKDLGVRRENYKKEWGRKADEFEMERKAIAESIVADHALLTAIKTATSPWKIVDIIAVFYNSTRMIERIARLYGQRCTGPQAFRLVCQWGFNLYVAGELGEVFEKGAEITADKAIELLEKTGCGISWLGGVLPVAVKIFAKAGEGAANYYFCKRLGTAAIDAFKPDFDHPSTSKPVLWPILLAALIAIWFLVFGIVALTRFHRGANDNAPVSEIPTTVHESDSTLPSATTSPPPSINENP